MEVMDESLRMLTAADAAIVWEMLRHAAHEPSVAAVQNQPCLTCYAANWGRSGDLGYGAIRDEAVVGAAWLRVWSQTERGFGYVREDIPELAIAVLPPYRGQGLGTQLLRQILAVGQEQFPAISLNVRAEKAVVRWYERMGFIKVSGSDRVNRAGGVSFNMVRQSPAAR